MTAIQDAFDRLPEFPLETFESIGQLERSDHGPFLTNKPPRVEGRPSAPLPESKKKSSHAVRHHFAWATYPRVVCHDPGPFVDGLQIADDVPGESGLGRPTDDLVEVARQVQHYRLSSLAGRMFPRPLWCTVTYGPWAADFKETESCYVDEDPMWEFTLVGVNAPEVAAVWYGAETDLPAVPSLEVIWGTLQHGEWGQPVPCDG